MNKRDLDQAINTLLPSNESSDDSDHEEMTRIRTLKEMAAPDLELQPLCIQYPQREDAFELKSGMIHLLPSFHGLSGEDLNKHLKEFHVVCTSMKPSGTTEEQVKLSAFPSKYPLLQTHVLHLVKYMFSSPFLESYNDLFIVLGLLRIFWG